MAKTLAHFSIARSGEEYVLTLEDADGESAEFTCDYDQLDLIAEEVDAQLDSDEEEMLDADEEDDESPEDD